MQRKKEEWGFGQNDDEMQDSEKDDFNADFDDYYEAVVDESDSVDSVDLSSSKAIKEHMVDLANQHFEECENVFLKLKKTIDEGIQPEDERTQLLLHMFKDSSFIEKRLEAVSDDNVILRIRYKYFMVPKCFLEIFPHLKDCIAVFN